MNPSDVPVVIGEGTRLREETQARPKPLIDIGTEPILMHIMRLYSAHGFRRFILCLGYRGMMIKQFFLDRQIRIHDLKLDMSTGIRSFLGALSKRQIARYREDAADRKAAMSGTISMPSGPEPQLS